MSALITAIQTKDIDTALKLLTDEAVRATVADNDNEALRLAARNGLLPVVQELLQIEAVRNNAAAVNNQALLGAALYGHFSVVQELLQIEAVRKNAAAENNYALRYAAQYGHLSVVQELLQIEAVRKNAAAENNYALRWAAMNGHLQVVLELLQIEAVRKNAAAENNDALRWAAQCGYLPVVQELLQIEAVRNNAAAENNDALRWAARNGHLSVVQELLQIEAVRNNAAAENNQVLRFAAQCGYLPVVQELLQIEAVRNNAAAENNDALRYAAECGHLPVVQELLQHPVVVNNIAINNHAVLRAAAEEKPWKHSKLLLMSYLIELYKKNKITLPEDVMIDVEGGSRNILSLDFEKTSDEAAAVLQNEASFSHSLTRLLFEFAGLPFKVKPWHEQKAQEAEALLQAFNEGLKQAEEYSKEIFDLIQSPYFPTGLIYRSRLLLIQNITQKINEIKADIQRQLKLMREIPESNNAAWNSIEEQLKKQRIQLSVWQQQIAQYFTGLVEVQIQTLVNKFQALARINKTFSQTFAVNTTLQKLKTLDENSGLESHERLKAIQAIFEPIKNLAMALLRDKEALLVTQNITLEIKQLYQEALRIFKQGVPNNVQNEALMQELNLAKAALENIRRAEARVEQEQQDNLNGAQQTLAEAYQEFHALTEIMQKVKHLVRSFKPIVKEEPKVDKPQVIHESPALVWSEPKPTTPEITHLITDLRAMRNLLQKSKTEDPKKAVEELMIKIEAQIKTHSITASTLVEPKKPLAEILYEWFSRNEGLYNRLCNLFNNNSPNYKL